MTTMPPRCATSCFRGGRSGSWRRTRARRRSGATTISRREALSIEAAKGSLDFYVGRELSALGLGKALQHIQQVRGVDGLGPFVTANERKHGARDLILSFRRQAAHHFKSLFEQLRHRANLHPRSWDLKELGPGRRSASCWHASCCHVSLAKFSLQS